MAWGILFQQGGIVSEEWVGKCGIVLFIQWRAGAAHPGRGMTWGTITAGPAEATWLR